MKHSTYARWFGVTAPALALLGVMAAPREAGAQVRASAYLGAERIAGGGQSSATFVARAEATMSFIPWFQAGIYGQTLSPFEDASTGWGLGAIATLRPGLPGTTIDPMGYASIGYQRAPTGVVFNSGPLFELGGGLSWHLIPVLDLELRAGYVGLFGDDKMHGFSGAIGLSLHP